MRIGSCVCRKPSFWLFLGLVIICIFRKNRDDVVMVLDGEGGTSSLHPWAISVHAQERNQLAHVDKPLLAATALPRTARKLHPRPRAAPAPSDQGTSSSSPPAAPLGNIRSRAREKPTGTCRQTTSRCDCSPPNCTEASSTSESGSGTFGSGNIVVIPARCTLGQYPFTRKRETNYHSDYRFRFPRPLSLLSLGASSMLFLS